MGNRSGAAPAAGHKGLVLLCHKSPLQPLGPLVTGKTQFFPRFFKKGEKTAFNFSLGVLLCSHQPEPITPVTLITDRWVASVATFRVTGPVLDSTRRKGIAQKSGNPYDFTQITVLVGGRGTVELTLPDDPSIIGGQIPSRMDTVDFVVEVTPRASGFGTQVIGLYSSTALADLASVV